VTDQDGGAGEPDELARWAEVGQLLREGRERRGISKRAAAAEAGFSETVWRQLEAGERQIAKGMKIPISPKDETLLRASYVARVDPGRLFDLAGRARSVRPGDRPR
jgi:transcriptional regulator with XRE-family HTH domain